jgi:hypothetical protein
VASIIERIDLDCAGNLMGVRISLEAARCLMQYADSMGITNFGGVGECVHSDGSRLDIVW